MNSLGIVPQCWQCWQCPSVCPEWPSCFIFHWQRFVIFQRFSRRCAGYCILFGGILLCRLFPFRRWNGRRRLRRWVDSLDRPGRWCLLGPTRPSERCRGFRSGFLLPPFLRIRLCWHHDCLKRSSTVDYDWNGHGEVSTDLNNVLWLWLWM